jgi:phosphatidate cytidylyltransferase
MYQRRGRSPSPAQRDVNHPKPAPSKWTDLGIRLFWGFGLIGLQLLILAVGPWMVTIEVIVVAFLGYSESLRLIPGTWRVKDVPLFIEVLPYIWFALFIYTLKGLQLITFLKGPQCLVDHHYVLCYAIGILLVVAFVLNLNSRIMQFAFELFIPMVFGTIIIVIPCLLYGSLAEVSVFWFYIAASLVVHNDSAAYFCGRKWGRHRLIGLSPNKTVEGFVGALIFCIFSGYFQPLIFARWPFAYCSNIAPFDFFMTCDVPYYWVKTDFVVFGKVLWQHYPVQLHSLAFGLFASLIAPFGGFLASGLKRCLGLKDFGNLIPGHGGIIDRMDCQLVMGSFAILYLKSFVLK